MIHMTILMGDLGHRDLGHRDSWPMINQVPISENNSRDFIAIKSFKCKKNLPVYNTV